MCLEISPIDSIAPTPTSSGVLLLAAVAGLMGALVPACNSDSNSDGDSAAKVTATVVDKDMTFDEFSADCAERGGFVQTHAVCSGNNSCKGNSYNKYSYSLTEHTCKGMNSCGGMSCVLTPADMKKAGAVVFAESCAGCHGSTEGGFTYYVPPGMDLTAAATAFAARPAIVQASIVAFGTLGVNENGTSYTNMPAFHEKYSRVEIERAVEYLRTLEIVPEEYGIVGITEEIGDATGM